MTTLLTILLVLVAGLTGQDRAGDLERMQGEWELQSTTAAGVTKPADGSRLRIQGREATLVMANGFEVRGTIELDATKTPRECNLVLQPAKNGRISPPIPGIYELDGDSLKMCLNGKPPELVRPRKFEAVADDGNRINIYKRRIMGPDSGAGK